MQLIGCQALSKIDSMCYGPCWIIGLVGFPPVVSNDLFFHELFDWFLDNHTVIAFIIYAGGPIINHTMQNMTEVLLCSALKTRLSCEPGGMGTFWRNVVSFPPALILAGHIAGSVLHICSWCTWRWFVCIFIHISWVTRCSSLFIVGSIASSCCYISCLYIL